jgi:hypothetical protein
MNQPPKSGKRIVSKGKYLVNTGKKATLSSFGAVVFLLGIVSAVIICFKVVPVFWSSPNAITGLLLVLILGGGSSALIYLGRKAVKEGKELDTGVPFTRANTADLPPADSLVRASDEPVQEQKTILLRAATHGQETRPEELVRAAVGPQDPSESRTA